MGDYVTGLKKCRFAWREGEGVGGIFGSCGNMAGKVEGETSFASERFGVPIKVQVLAMNGGKRPRSI